MLHGSTLQTPFGVFMANEMSQAHQIITAGAVITCDISKPHSIGLVTTIMLCTLSGRTLTPPLCLAYSAACQCKNEQTHLM